MLKRQIFASAQGHRRSRAGLKTPSPKLRLAPGAVNFRAPLETEQYLSCGARSASELGGKRLLEKHAIAASGCKALFGAPRL